MHEHYCMDSNLEHHGGPRKERPVAQGAGGLAPSCSLDQLGEVDGDELIGCGARLLQDIVIGRLFLRLRRLVGNTDLYGAAGLRAPLGQQQQLDSGASALKAHKQEQRGNEQERSIQKHGLSCCASRCGSGSRLMHARRQ